MQKPVIRDVTAEDVEHLIAHLRAGDAVEIEKSCPEMSVEDAVRLSVRSADVCYSVIYGGELICICGAGLINLRESRAVIWALGTAAMERIPRAVVRYSRPVLGLLMDALPPGISGYNAVWDGHQDALKWLKWIGAQFVYSVFERDESFTVFQMEGGA